MCLGNLAPDLFPKNSSSNSSLSMVSLSGSVGVGAGGGAGAHAGAGAGACVGVGVGVGLISGHVGLSIWPLTLELYTLHALRLQCLCNSFP